MRRLTYITMMLYFLGIGTGSISALLMEYKLRYTFILEGEDETNSTRSTLNLIEEDVLCHDNNYFLIAHYLLHAPLNSDYNSTGTLEVSLAMVAPPPERA